MRASGCGWGEAFQLIAVDLFIDLVKVLLESVHWHLVWCVEVLRGW